MAVNTEFVGRIYPPSGPYAVSAEDIADCIRYRLVQPGWCDVKVLQT